MASSRIKAREVPQEVRLLTFSFKYLSCFHPGFAIEECGADYLIALAKKLAELSLWSVHDFTDQNQNQHRHVIDWSQTTEPDGFPGIDADNLGMEYPWQFALNTDDQASPWRVHGVLLEDVAIFYLVLLDPNHRLCKSSLTK